MTRPSTHRESLAVRRQRLRAAETVYGLDFVEVLAANELHTLQRVPGPWQEAEQTAARKVAGPVLRLHFLGARPARFTAHHFRIVRGGQLCSFRVVALSQPAPDHADPSVRRTKDCVDVELDRWGDRGVYALELVDHSHADSPLGQQERCEPSVDPFFRQVTFFFYPDRASEDGCPAPRTDSRPAPEPVIDYLAKDYAGFRQLLLDRLATTLPDWRERNPADTLVTLVEILAYEADHLSYYQDAVASEAYLQTCRLRQSLRKHARLADYHAHEGCNARAWVQIELIDRDEAHWDSRDVFFVALRQGGLVPAGEGISARTLARWLNSDLAQSVAVFEPLTGHNIDLWRANNEIEIYDWLGALSQLPIGATSATVCSRSAERICGIGDLGPIHLRVGDVLIFEEVRNPFTGEAAEADPSHRHAVRITSVQEERDPLENRPIVRVGWSRRDALPFTLWIRRAELGPAPISVARGNMVLVDHGCHTRETLNWPNDGPPLVGNDSRLPRRRADSILARVPLTHRERISASKSATSAMKQDPRNALPDIVIRDESDRRPLPCHPRAFDDPTQLIEQMRRELRSGDGSAQNWRQVLSRTVNLLKLDQQWSDSDGSPLAPSPGLATLCRPTLAEDLRRLVWLPRFDLLDSGPTDGHFVVEIDDEGHAHLRFGDGLFGRRPAVGASLRVDYRVGNGTAGNVAAESIAHAGFYRGQGAACRVRNPLPATGGIDPEPSEDIRTFAPHAIRSELQRAITAEDYERLVMRNFRDAVQRVKASLRWTGHEYEALVAVDPWEHEQASGDLVRQISRYLARYRRIGHELRVVPARRVPLALTLSVSVEDESLTDYVAVELNELFSNRRLRDGGEAFFHPDRVTFGEGVYVSRIVAAAAQIAGVRNVVIKRLSRLDADDLAVLSVGVLWLGSDEIAQLANDPAMRELGELVLLFEERR